MQSPHSTDFQHRDLDHLVLPVPELQRLWEFTASSVSTRQKLQRLRCHLWRTSPPPPHHVVKHTFPSARWNLLFLFAPEGQISDSQAFTLQRLQATPVPLLVVVATASPELIPAGLIEACDGLIWKGLSGYDFSAYQIGLKEISTHAPGADLFVMNDSVFGPFGNLESLVTNAPWGLTGFTSSALGENHIQSYAFILKSVDPGLLKQLEKVLLPTRAFDIAGDVILCQELAFARIAAQATRVGSYWHSPGHTYDDAMLHSPKLLVDAGLPFIKKSLLGKMRSFQDTQSVRNMLHELGHPVEPITP